MGQDCSAGNAYVCDKAMPSAILSAVCFAASSGLSNLAYRHLKWVGYGPVHNARREFLASGAVWRSSTQFEAFDFIASIVNNWFAAMLSMMMFSMYCALQRRTRQITSFHVSPFLIA